MGNIFKKYKKCLKNIEDLQEIKEKLLKDMINHFGSDIEVLHFDDKSINISIMEKNKRIANVIVDLNRNYGYINTWGIIKEKKKSILKVCDTLENFIDGIKFERVTSFYNLIK